LVTQPYSSLAKYQFGDLRVEYVMETDTVGLLLYPNSMKDELIARRQFLPWKPQKFPDIVAQEVESLVQFKLLGDSSSDYSQGITMRNSDTLSSLRYSKQEKIERGDETEIITYLSSARGYACEHHLRYRQGDEALTFYSTIRNEINWKFSRLGSSKDMSFT